MGVDEDFAITEEELVRLAESIRERSSVGSAFSPVFERSVVDPLDGALAKTVGPGLTEGERYTMETALSMLTGCDDGHATGLSDVELVDALERAEGRYEEMPGGVVETPFTASDLRTIVDDAMEAAVDPLPTNPLVEDLQNMGYHFEEGQVEGELRVDGSATNPDPSWEAVGKMVSKAVSDLNQLPDRPYQAVRVGRDRIRAI